MGLTHLVGLPALLLVFCIAKQRPGGLGCLDFKWGDGSLGELFGDVGLRGLRLRDRGEFSEGGMTLTTRTGVMTL